VPGDKQHEAPKKADAFAKLVQCLDDRISLSGLVIREALWIMLYVLRMQRQRYEPQKK
jgi:hypothetical protein